jgi:hypothetical protein
MLCDPDKRAAATAAVQAELAKIARRGFAPALIGRPCASSSWARSTPQDHERPGLRASGAEGVVGDLHYSRHYFERLAAIHRPT